ncbi:MAG TPA: FAD-dependent oxidoreductase [Streptosporangiaceae bacterium]|nr:FAD-dependent oxidoreductase [Streptosporangiaceae bacterium]
MSDEAPGPASGPSEAAGPRDRPGGRRPRSAVIVGAGMAGLATAWFLRRHGVEVTVVERRHVAAGASWGNAGWLSPAFAAPLNEPGTLRHGLGGLLKSTSPLYIPPRADPRLAAFLLAFTFNCTPRRWRAGMRAFAALNPRALAAYDLLAEGGVAEPTKPSEPCLLATCTLAEHQAVVAELERVRAAGQEVRYDVLTGDEARSAEPALTGRIGAAVRLHGQRYLHPGRYVTALADAVRARGGTIIEHAEVTAVDDRGGHVRVRTAPTANDLAGAGAELTADVVVLATGAWLSRLARRFGVRVPVQSGRGYSFTVSGTAPPSGPTYFPTCKVVCTPLTDSTTRIAGTMEFTGPDRPLDPRRIDAIVAAARPLLRGVDWASRGDEWTGPRPCTPDGLPLVGATRSPRVYVCGGHGMWGIALGPLTGLLLADAIATGRTPPELAPLHPLR